MLKVTQRPEETTNSNQQEDIRACESLASKAQTEFQQTTIGNSSKGTMIHRGSHVGGSKCEQLPRSGRPQLGRLRKQREGLQACALGEVPELRHHRLASLLLSLASVLYHAA